RTRDGEALVAVALGERADDHLADLPAALGEFRRADQILVLGAEARDLRARYRRRQQLSELADRRLFPELHLNDRATGEVDAVVQPAAPGDLPHEGDDEREHDRAAAQEVGHPTEADEDEVRGCEESHADPCSAPDADCFRCTPALSY